MTRTRWGFSRVVAAVNGTGAVFWLGMVIWGIVGDCRPHDFHGDCGFETLFGGAIGLGGAFVLIAIGSVLQGFSPDFRAGDEVERFWLACATAVMAGIAALNVCVVVWFVLDRGYPLREGVGNGLGCWPLTAFLGAPCAYLITFVVAAASDRRVRRSGQVSPSWACRVGAIAGMIPGLMVGLYWAYSAWELAWMVIGGAWTGVVAAGVFWCVAIRGRVHVDATAGDPAATTA